MSLFKPGDVSLTALPPLALYIHIPWCIKKCPYCDFNSHQLPGSSILTGVADATSVPQDRYIDALIADLDQQLPKVWGRKLHSIFIGGGTPSLFSAESIDRLLNEVRARLGMPMSGEVTLEANPGTFEADKFKGFRQAGVTRLSIGVQSFNAVHLNVLGRVHDPEQAMAAAQLASSVFDRFNLDLMYGLPGQTVSQAVADIQQALAFSPQHLSLYQLTMEPNTAFAARPPIGLPEDDALIDIEEAVHHEALNAGLLRYEVSAFATSPTHQSKHNLNYWQFGDYLGIGAGAHAKISFPNRIVREMRVRHPDAYMDNALAGDAIAQSNEIKATDLPFEFMLNALRLVDGVPADYFTERCGRPVTDISTTVAKAQDLGLMRKDLGRWVATDKGMAFLNDLQGMFLAS